MRRSLLASILEEVKIAPMPIRKSNAQSFLLLGLICFFVAHFTLLNPSSLEEDFSEARTVAPKDLLKFFQNEPVTLAKNVPTAEAPDYSIRDLEYLSTDHLNKHWRMLSRKFVMFQAENMSHARDTTFYWSDGKITADEAVSQQDKSQVELYGHVVATLNNGLVLHTEYVKIITSPSTLLTVPTTETVRGDQPTKDATFHFTSQGLSYSNASPENETITLLSEARVDIITKEKTQVISDTATYHPFKDQVEFNMEENQPLTKQFVHTHQKTLNLQSRNLIVDLVEKKLQLLTAHGDVSFEDFTNAEHPVSGTAGRAKYHEKTQLLFLLDFPQVYQDTDTITGDVITYNRARDSIEVNQSNAFNKR